MDASATSTAVSESLPGRKRDKEFWFEDGNVILVVEDVEFRVYKGLLIERFPVFRDMFSSSQPDVPEMVADHGDPSCPIVHLPGDSARDWLHVLRMFMPRDNAHRVFFGDTSSKPSYAMVAACIRLGHKYQMTEMCEHAVRYLKKHFTTDVEVWTKGRGLMNLPPGWKLEQTIGVVNLARLTGECTILPTALFCCCLLGDKLVYGAILDCDNSRETLSEDDMAACVRAIPKLMREAIITSLDVDPPLPSEARCESGKNCKHLLKIPTHHAKNNLGDVTLRALLCRHWGLSIDAQKEVCAQCLEADSDRRTNRAKDMWKQLPAFFEIDVPGW